jgi:uncharacterized membrane protein YccC
MLRLKTWLRNEWRHLTAVTPSERPWQMPVAAALAAGVPLVLAAAFDRMDDGFIASLGGLVFLYLPSTALAQRMKQIAACALGMTACYTLGLLCHFAPWLTVPGLAGITMLVTMLIRRHKVGPPGSLFFVMVAAIGANTPMETRQFPFMVGWFCAGALFACLIALIYSLQRFRHHQPGHGAIHHKRSFAYHVFDAVIIGTSVGLSLALAHLLRLERSYWVPVACIAVIQGTTLRAVWNRQVHRIIGTTVGLLLAWAVLSLPLNAWLIAALVTGLMLVIETIVVRQYAVAAMFITPLGILLAEAADLGATPAAELIAARFYDTLLGAAVGFLGGVCLHSPRFRQLAGRSLRMVLLGLGL